MGLKSWKLTSDYELTDADHKYIADQILNGCTAGEFYSVDETYTESEETRYDKKYFIDRCKDLIKNGQLLGAVKLYKESTGKGLYDSKQDIDALRASMKLNNEI